MINIMMEFVDLASNIFSNYINTSTFLLSGIIGDSRFADDRGAANSFWRPILTVNALVTTSHYS